MSDNWRKHTKPKENFMKTRNAGVFWKSNLLILCVFKLTNPDNKQFSTQKITAHLCCVRPIHRRIVMEEYWGPALIDLPLHEREGNFRQNRLYVVGPGPTRTIFLIRNTSPYALNAM